MMTYALPKLYRRCKRQIKGIYQSKESALPYSETIKLYIRMMSEVIKGI